MMKIKSLVVAACLMLVVRCAVGMEAIAPLSIDTINAEFAALHGEYSGAVMYGGDEDFRSMAPSLSMFLDELIIRLRGLKDGAGQPCPAWLMASQRIICFIEIAEELRAPDNGICLVNGGCGVSSIKFFQQFFISQAMVQSRDWFEIFLKSLSVGCDGNAQPCLDRCFDGCAGSLCW